MLGVRLPPSAPNNEAVMNNTLDFLVSDDWYSKLDTMSQFYGVTAEVCVINCSDALSFGVYTVYPQIGFYITFGF